MLHNRETETGTTVLIVGIDRMRDGTKAAAALIAMRGRITRAAGSPSTVQGAADASGLCGMGWDEVREPQRAST